MKNNDLKFELQLTEIDKGEEGEIAVEEWRAGGAFENWILQVFSWNWTVTGMTLTPWHQSLRGSCESYTLKTEQKANGWREPSGLVLLCQSSVKVFDGCHTSGAPLVQLLRRPRSPRRHYGRKYWFHSVDWFLLWSLEMSKMADVTRYHMSRWEKSAFVYFCVKVKLQVFSLLNEAVQFSLFV